MLPWLRTCRDHLNQSLANERLGHAPLLHGPAGLGKRSLADWLVRRLLCLAPNNGNPCGACRACQLLDSGTHPDLFAAAVPEDRTQLTVDVIRELNRGLELTPALGPRRIGLIAEADQMNRNAANALLKTLEEPAGQAWLVLVSDRPDALPATVLSRCQKLAVRPPPTEQAMAWLAEEVKAADPAQHELALEVAGGAPLRARQLLQEQSLEFGLEIRSALLEMAKGNVLEPGLTETWAGRADEAWHWLAFWTRQWTGSALGLGEDTGAPADAERLAERWQAALTGRALADGSIRADLLLGKWLLEWEALFPPRG